MAVTQIKNVDILRNQTREINLLELIEFHKKDMNEVLSQNSKITGTKPVFFKVKHPFTTESRHESNEEIKIGMIAVAADNSEGTTTHVDYFTEAHHLIALPCPHYCEAKDYRD